MIHRFLHILSSISLLAVIYLINNAIGVGTLLGKIGIRVNCDFPQWISNIVYVSTVIGFAGILTQMFRCLRPGELLKQNIERLDADNSGPLAMILAYVFVGLSIHNGWTLIAVMSFLIIFNLCGSSHIYNPLFYLFGYHYYYVTSSKTKILVMTRTKYPLGADADFKQCGCLNDYTYIDLSRKNT